MIAQIDQSQLGVVASLFKEHRRRRSAIDHILQGNNGVAEADDDLEPTIARLRLGHLMLFGGDPLLPTARELVENLERVIAVPETSAWHDLIYESNRHRPIKTWNRTDFSSSELDPERLFQLSNHIREEGFRVVPITPDLTTQLAEVFGSPPFGTFRSVGQFFDLGFGYCGFLGNTLVCSAFSSTVCKRSIGIQINTHDDYRQRGFATAVGATIILHCLENGLGPDWNAATSISASLARKFGYVECDSYEEFQIAWS